MNTVKPTKKQLDFMSWELGVFFHFGIRTFHEGHVDWDGLEMPADTFAPAQLDCEQWCRIAREGGANYAILTTKHHDGFALWPTKYTDYSVKNCQWRDGKGDVVREFTDACRKYGLKVGLYYSPAQVDEKQQSAQEYEDYFFGQVEELLANYGKIDYLWFDCCGSEERIYNKSRIANLRALQPDMLFLGGWDPDVRWSGNEEGIAPFGIKNTVCFAQLPANSGLEKFDGYKFLPYECDCRIRRFNWFYSDNDTQLLRSAEDMLALYDYSVGQGGNLLINIAPDRRGLLPEQDSAVFLEFGKRLQEQFSNPEDIQINREGDVYEIVVKNPANIKTIVLEEDLEQGEKIHAFEIGIAHTKYCKIDEYIKLVDGQGVGHKRIIRIPSLYVGSWYTMKLAITDAQAGYVLKGIRLYR